MLQAILFIVPRRVAATAAARIVPPALADIAASRAVPVVLAITMLVLVQPARAQHAGSAPRVSVSARPTSGMAPGEHHVVVNGVRLWYKVAGEKSEAPPVVFLHGGPGANSQRFASLVGSHLEDELRMVYLDQRGSGRSERPWNDEYSIDLLVNDLEALRRHLGAEQISLIGHSFGTLVALEYAATHPEHVRRIVLSAAVSDFGEAVQSSCDRLAEVNPEAHERATADGGCDIFGAMSEEEREAFFTANMFPDPTTEAKIDSVDAAHGLRNTRELSSALFRQGLLNYAFDDHDRVTMPVLVIAGRHDYQAGIEPQRALAKQLPNARFEEFEESGHFMYVDESAKFARVVIPYLLGDD